MRRDVDLARTMGISPRELWGWTPRTFTEYEYDDDGKLLRTVSVTESAFDDENYQLAAAGFDLLADIHSCGHPLSETTSWAADEMNPERTIVYEAAPPAACQACRVLHRKQKEHDDAKTSRPDQVWSVVRRD